MHIYTLAEVLAAIHIKDELMRQPRFQDPQLLIAHGDKRFSQADEDGIIEEIFNRIGSTTRSFVEIGVQNGLECNSLALLLSGWRGTWIEGNESFVAFIRAKNRCAIDDGRLAVLHRFVDAANALSIANECKGHPLDLLSIDIDGNDFHVASPFVAMRPRVVVLEYNGRFGPRIDWVMPYNAAHHWDGTDYFGASLAAWKRLMNAHGYALVSCNVLGSNTFFVRRDCLGGSFHRVDDVAFHFEPTRYHLLPAFQISHPLDERVETTYL